MSLLKYIERLKRMDDLIRRKATGTPEEFAERLGVRKTILMEELRELKELGAEVCYNRIIQSYHYENDFVLKIGSMNNLEQASVRGGQNFLSDFLQFGITELTNFSLAVQSDKNLAAHA